jgi:gluconokinase
MRALGLVASVERAAEVVPIAETVAPDPAAAAVYAEALPVFDALYDDLGPAFTALRELGRPSP